MSKVYLFDQDSEEVVAVGQQTDETVVVSDENFTSFDDVAVIAARDFYLDERVQGIVPEGTHHTQIHVECTVCGFETVFGVRALMQDTTYGRTELNGYPKPKCSCDGCGENAWREVERQLGPCDWSDSFDWAEPPSPEN